MKSGRNLWALALLLVASRAQAFTLLADLSAGWDTTSLTFEVNESSCTGLGISAGELHEAIDAAVDAWNSVPTANLKLVKGGDSTGTANASSPVIYCSTTPGNSIAGTGSVGVLGGRPVVGGLVLNGDVTKDAYFGSLTSAQQKIVVTHEIGHVLGMGHSDQEYALMYYNIGEKAELRLSQDDIDALTWLHPRNEFSDGIMGCSTAEASEKGTPPSGGTLSWLVLFLLAWMATRRLGGTSRKSV